MLQVACFVRDALHAPLPARSAHRGVQSAKLAAVSHVNSPEAGRRQLLADGLCRTARSIELTRCRAATTSTDDEDTEYVPFMKRTSDKVEKVLVGSLLRYVPVHCLLYNLRKLCCLCDRHWQSEGTALRC